MQTPQNRSFFHAGLWKLPAIAAAAGIVLLFWRDVVLEVLGIIFGGAVIAFLLTPMCRILEKRLKRPVAAILVLAAALTLLAAVAALLLPALARQVLQLAEVLPGAFARLSALMQGMGARLQRYLPGWTLPEVNLAGMDFGSTAREAVSTIGSLAGGVYRCFLMAVLSYFLICDRERILLYLELLVPVKWRKTAVRSGMVLMRQLRLYLRGQMTIALAVGMVATLAMMLLRLDGALVLGLTVGVCNVIPYFGPFIGGIPAVIAALNFGWQRAMLTVLALFAVQQIDGLLISPRVMGSITGFSPAVVLMVLFIGARIGGIGAMLLALPALMTFRTVYRVFVQLHEKN